MELIEWVTIATIQGLKLHKVQLSGFTLHLLVMSAINPVLQLKAAIFCVMTPKDLINQV